MAVADCVVALRIGVLCGILVVDSVHQRALEDRLARHFAGAQRRCGVGGEVGIARSRREYAYPVLLQMPHRPAPDVGLGHLVHPDGGDHPAMASLRLERVLHGQRIHDRGEHAHVVRRGAVHSLRGPLKSAEDVSAADHHADLDAELAHRAHLLGDPPNPDRVESVAPLAQQRLAGNLQKNPPVGGLGAFPVRHRCSLRGCPAGIRRQNAPEWRKIQLRKRDSRQFAAIRPGHIGIENGSCRQQTTFPGTFRC